jgi:hypothetical protein
MRIRVLVDPPSRSLSEMLQAFEREFYYPLGQGRFRISHGEDYLRFYRSMGMASCCIADDEDGILGMCCAVRREIHHPQDGTRSVLYLGDLKLAVRARGRYVLWRLADAIREHYSGIQEAYSVVMKGTSRSPDTYTGRAGLPVFGSLGTVQIWRLGIDSNALAAGGARIVSEEQGVEAFRRLATNQCYVLGGVPQLRSLMQPQWWLSEDGQACGRLEDTRLAKRLFRDDGEEMVNAHLSAFAYANSDSGHRLVQAVCYRLAQSGYSSLFLALSESADLLPGMFQYLPEHSVASAATVYGTGLSPATMWNIFTSEI